MVDYPQEDTEWIRGIILSKWIIWIIWGGSLVGLLAMGKKVTKEKGEKRAKAKGGAKGDFWSLSTESGNYVILFVKDRTTKLGKAVSYDLNSAWRPRRALLVLCMLSASESSSKDYNPPIIRMLKG